MTLFIFLKGTALVTRFGGDDFSFFRADHPFIYYIWDKKLRTIIFNGRLIKF